MFQSRYALRFGSFTVALLVTLTLAACGGGGGGGGSNGGGGGGTSAGGNGGFTLASTSATFGVLRNRPAPADARIALTVTGSAVAAVGAAFVNQAPPTWLRVTLEGTSPNLTLVLGISDTNQTPGRQTATVTVGTANSAGSVLTTREVQVTADFVEPMNVTVTPQNPAFVFGSSRNTEPVTVTVGAPGKSWTITSNQAWLPAPGGAQQGDGTLTLTLNAAATGAVPGTTARAQLVIQNTAEPLDRHVFNVDALIARPTPTVSPAPVRIGGFTGLDGVASVLDVSLDTGANAYPYTVTIETPQAAWVVSDVSAGNAGGAQHSSVTLSAAPPIGVPGDYTATAHFDATVLGQVFRTSVPVSMRWHGQRLVPSHDGVAFSSFPARQRLTRTVRIDGSRGIDGVPWTAASSQSWLAVTAAGVTGGNLVLTANPAGLAANTVHVAEVVLSSTSANIERSERMRVAIWVGNTNPANVSSNVADFPNDLVVNPVEPYAYALFGGLVHVFNVYTGAEINAFDGGASGALESGGARTYLALSSDGSTLFAANLASAQLIVMNAATGSVRDTLQLENRFGSALDSKPVFARVNGHPVLFTPFGNGSTTVLDVEAGVAVGLSRESVTLFEQFRSLRTVSPDGRRFFTIDDASTSDTVNEFSLAFGTLGGRTLQINVSNAFFIFGGGFIRQMCVNESGTRLFAQNGVLHQVALDIDPPHDAGDVAAPAMTAVQGLDCHWSGRLYAGLTTLGAPQNNTFAIDAVGNSLGSFLSGPADSGLMVGLMFLSGDARRIVSMRVESADPAPIFRLHFYDVPN